MTTKKWLSSWKKSAQPKKKKKYQKNAPLHIKHKFLGAHLSKELIKKYKTRSLPVRSGDFVKVIRGQFKKRTGKITEIDIKKTKIYVDGIQRTKRDGTKVNIPLHPSKVILTVVNLEDKLRKRVLERKGLKQGVKK